MNNELDYFKSEAKKLFDMNKELRKENSEAKQKLKEYEWELENREVIMQKLWYKYNKEKFHKDKLKNKMDEQLQNIQNEASNKRKNSNPQIIQSSIKQTFFHTETLSSANPFFTNQ